MRTRRSSLGIINKNNRISAALTEPTLLHWEGSGTSLTGNKLTRCCPSHYSQPRLAAVGPSSAVAPLDKICDLNKFPRNFVLAPHQLKIVLSLSAQNVPRWSPAAALLCRGAVRGEAAVAADGHSEGTECQHSTIVSYNYWCKQALEKINATTNTSLTSQRFAENTNPNPYTPLQQRSCCRAL